MSESVLRIKAKDFAKKIIFLCRTLKINKVESALVNQLLRSGTSIGANIHEAQYAQGIKILYQNLKLLLKNVTKANIGSICFMT